MLTYTTLIGVLQHGSKAKWVKGVFTIYDCNILGKVPLIAITTRPNYNDIVSTFLF